MRRRLEVISKEQEGKEISMKNVILIAGVHGVSGRAAAEHWVSLPDTRVYGLSRRSGPLPAGVEAISADLQPRKRGRSTALPKQAGMHGSLN